MIWTHIYDLILKIITFIFSIFIAINLPFLENKDFLIIMSSIVLYFAVYNIFIRTFATYLYCKYALKMNINLNQAKDLNNAFSPIFPLNLKWLPMREIRNVTDNEKYETALKLFKNYKEQHKNKISEKLNEFIMSNNKVKILRILMYALIIYFIIAGFMNLPPASYLSNLYFKLFETEEYYPVINICILVFPTLLIFKKIDPNIN